MTTLVIKEIKAYIWRKICSLILHNCSLILVLLIIMSTLISLNSVLLVKSHQYLCSLIFQSKLSKLIPLETQYHISWNDMFQYNNIYNCFWMTHYCNAKCIGGGGRWIGSLHSTDARGFRLVRNSTVRVTPLQPTADRCEEMPTLLSCTGNSLDMKMEGIYLLV